MSPSPKETLPTKACVNSTARSDSNSKRAAVQLRPFDENILRISEEQGKSRSALACDCVIFVVMEEKIRSGWRSCPEKVACDGILGLWGEQQQQHQKMREIARGVPGP